MTSRERVRRTFEFEKTDRVPIGYDTNPRIHARLCKTLGVRADDWETLLDALGVDTRGIGAPYTGPLLFKPLPNRNVDALEGHYTRWVKNKFGGYWDFCDFPLQDADDAAFDAFPVPDPDDFDYAEARAKAKSYKGRYALHVGSPGIPDVINSNGRIMGMEDVLCHLMLGDEAALRFMRRRAAFQLGMLERLLDRCKGLIDFVWLGEDLGTQRGPMIGLDLYRKTLKPIHRQFVDLATSHELPCLIHTCGSSSWAYEDFIGMGVRGVDTLQPEAADMSPHYLVDHFGGRLNFRGCISTAGALAYGTAAQVRKVCNETLETMRPVGGYHFAPTHQIQDNTPVANVLAMYQAAHSFA